MVGLWLTFKSNIPAVLRTAADRPLRAKRSGEMFVLTQGTRHRWAERAVNAPSMGVLRLHGALSSWVCWVGVGKLGRSLLT